MGSGSRSEGFEHIDTAFLDKQVNDMHHYEFLRQYFYILGTGKKFITKNADPRNLDKNSKV